MEEYFFTCHGWMIFMDKNGDEKWQWMNFSMNICNKFCFEKNWTKEIGYKKFMLVYCEQSITNHIKFEITSNSKTHKFVDPLRGMCHFKQYMSTTKRYATIRNWDNIGTPWHFNTSNSFYFHLLFQPFGNLHNEIALFFILLLIFM